MKILVLSPDYPSNDRKATLHYVHVRNKYYIKNNIDVTVLNFLAKEDYMFEGIKVITLNSYIKRNTNEIFDILVCHAPNIRHHYKFLKKYENKYNKLVFFFHGHEVLRINKVYPKPYDYMKNRNRIKLMLQDIYDTFKLFIWKNYYTKIVNKSHFVFVSKWMYEEFIKWTKIDKSIIKNRMSITYNSVDSIYERESYSLSKVKEYDFVTIRSVLDGSKYCIDLICKLANNNPQSKFLLIGKGKFFEYNDKPKNITWINEHFKHDKIIEILNKSRCALMPTRTDAQGLMMCEMATFGMPVITSNIQVCYEVLEGFENVEFIDNENINVDLNYLLTNLEDKISRDKNEKYFNKNTSGNEINIFNTILN